MDWMVEMRTGRELNGSYMIGMFVEGFAEVEQMHEHLRAKADGRASPHEDGLWYRWAAHDNSTRGVPAPPRRGAHGIVALLRSCI